jgi:hypothetical protein
MWDYYAHTSGRGCIKVEQNLRRREYATVNRECSKERKSFTKETEARWVKHHNHDTDTRCYRRPGDKPPPSAQGPPWQMVWWVKGLMNHPILKVATNMGLLRTQEGGETVLTWNEIHTDGNMPLLLGNAVRKDKASQRKPRHWGQTPQSRHRHQMLVGDRSKPPPSDPRAASVGKWFGG